MSPTPAHPERRKPQQARAAARRTNFLDVAARLIGDAGYESVTMKGIAEAAGASIGTLYDYFPDKQALALALLAQYAHELDAYWATVLDGTHVRDKDAFADFLVDAIVAFVRDRPAYLILLDAPVRFSRTAGARQPLRSTIANALRNRHPRLSDERARVTADVIVELIKALLAMYKRGSAKEQHIAVTEFRNLLRLYLGALA